MTSLDLFERVKAFFRDNPDEVLTRHDVCVKFDCTRQAAVYVAKALIQQGHVTRAQLPRDRVIPATRRSTHHFPHNLAPAERKLVETVVAHGSISAAIEASGLIRITAENYLNVARRKAGVNSTAELVRVYRQATEGAQAC